MIYLLTAIGLTAGGSSTVHIYTQTIHRTTKLTQTINRTTQLTNWEECGPCPIFASYTLAFAIKLVVIGALIKIISASVLASSSWEAVSSQQSRNFAYMTQPVGSFHCPLQHGTGVCPEPDGFNPHHSTLLLLELHDQNKYRHNGSITSTFMFET